MTLPFFHLCPMLSRSCRGRLMSKRRSGVTQLTTTFELLFLGLMMAGLMSGLHCWKGANKCDQSRLPILRLSVTSNGRELWIRRGISEVVSFNLQTSDIQRVVRSKHYNILNCLVSDDGQTYLVSSDANDLRICRHKSPILFEPGDGDLTVRTALSANGATAVRVLSGQQVQYWDITSDTAVASTFSLPEPVERIALDSAGRRLVTVTDRGIVHVSDVHSGMRIQTLTGSGPITADPVLSPDGRWLVLGLRSSIDLFDLSTGQLVWSIPINESDGIQACAISPDGNWVASSGIMTGVQLIGRADGQIKSTSMDEKGLHRVVFSADSNTLYMGQDDGSIKVWPVNGGPASTLLGSPGKYN